jgi:hypothetical protein
MDRTKEWESMGVHIPPMLLPYFPNFMSRPSSFETWHISFAANSVNEYAFNYAVR